MDEFEYITAQDLDRAWLNFELDLPLKPGSNGEPNPFYVDRPDNPTATLEQSLLRSFYSPPKIFFSGLRGCGKSTELYRIAVNPGITRKYLPIHFSIKEGPGIDNLDYRDILLEIGGQMYRQYTKSGGKLEEQLLKELDSWRGRIEKEITITPRMSEAELGANLGTFFGEVGLKVKLEPRTREIVRQVIEQNIRELIELINRITDSIRNATKRWPLVLIDDLDKPDLERARDIFYGHRETMIQPLVPIVYTISSSLYYRAEIRELLGTPIFLPNVKLHERKQSDKHDPEGYRVLRMFIRKRMNPELITDDAIVAVTEASGGVFREMCRVMRGAILNAGRRSAARIEVEDVRKAEDEIRTQYWRFLTQTDRQILREIRTHNQYNQPDQAAPLLQTLAVIEYANGEPWCDVHPVLRKLLDETAEYDNDPAIQA